MAKRTILALSKKYLFLSSIFLCLYLGLIIGLRIGQTHLIFFPSSAINNTPKDIKLNYEEIWITMPKGQLYGWWIDSNLLKSPTVLYFYGNSSNLGDLLDKVEFFHDLGVSILLIDYRGYGKSQGAFPNEISLYEDAEASWSYLTIKKQILPQNIFVYGYSLGGAIAINLATRYPTMGGLIIESSFTSMSAVIDYYLPIQLFPKSLILTQKFDSLSKISSLKMPILIIHGTADKTIPYTMSQDLYKKASGAKSLILVEGANHANIQYKAKAEYRQVIHNWLIFCQKYYQYDLRRQI